MTILPPGAGEGSQALAFQQIDDYVAPTWPGGDHPQQFHLDLRVPDLADGEAQVLAAGATRHEHQPSAERRLRRLPRPGRAPVLPGVMSAPAIEAVDLVKTFDDFTAVDGVSFSVPAGHGLLDARPQRRGQDHHGADDDDAQHPDQRHRPGRRASTSSREPDAVRHRMGLTAQSATVDELLTGRENLRLIGRPLRPRPARW